MPLAASDKIDLLLRAFADRTRLRILAKLLECLSCCFGELPALKADLKRLGTCCDVQGASCCD